MLNVVVLWGLHEEVVVVLVSRGDHVLSAYPRRGRLVVLALRNRLQFLSGSFDILLVKFATYFNPLIIVTSTSRRETFCNPLSCLRCDKYFSFSSSLPFLQTVFAYCYYVSFQPPRRLSELSGGVGGGIFLL